MLSPRCRFDVNLEDESGTTTAMIMGKDAEKLLSLSAEEIYALASTEDDSQSMESNKIRLSQNLFKIEVKKSVSCTSRTPSGKLFVLSCTEKENIVHSLPPPPTANTKENNKKKRHEMLTLKQKIA